MPNACTVEDEARPSVIANREGNCEETSVRFDSSFIRQQGVWADLFIKDTNMDNSNLFSHPDAPEYVVSGQVSAKPVEYPKFSDRPDADAAISAIQRP
jgi:hypothetical protein